MLSRYVKFADKIEPIVRKLQREWFRFAALKPGRTLSGTEINSVEAIVDVLADVERIAAQLGAEEQPTLQMKEVLLSSLLFRLRRTETAAYRGSAAHQQSSALLQELASRAPKMWN